MLTNQRQTKRLREEIVVADESDVIVLKPRMTDHLWASKHTCSTKLSGERDSGKGAEYVEDGSVAMRSGTVEYSRDHLEFGFGSGPNETDHTIDVEESETSSLPNRPSKDTNLFNKKAMQNSSELALFRRLPAASSGLVQNQEIEFATQVVGSCPEFEDREAQATREMKRKLNPFVEEREASATRESSLKGVMPSERQRELPLAKPLSLEQFVTLMMSPPNLVRKPIFHKTDTHPAITSSNSDSGKSRACTQDQLTLSANMSPSVKPFAGTEMPGKSGEDLFLRADSLLGKGESTHRFDCNTVGPVPVASGYGSRTLTHSAAHMLKSSKENASALSSLDEKSYVQMVDNDLRELSETQIGVPKASDKVDNTTSGVLRDQMVESKKNGAMPKSSHFTGSTTPVLPETNNSSVKNTYFTAMTS